MTSLQELLAQKEALEQQIAQIKKAERADALQNARSLIGTFDLTVDELFGKQKSSVKAVAVKYRNPETGETWTGRGRAPRWLEGKNREDFAV
ncbi:H-NS family nucleoid-associated regulatory protein [Thauera mechernichensis]|uniref:H-NS family nucleoid-associated regulatory protein n=1 Tax=Thauera mechernichensis TaxID=82788 RepID=A0ABW3WB85_9RHOO|nr:MULTISPECIES: H-NS histone family protein [Thauera]ENO91791.1 histone family protein nucleoid-structuring protein H-NS [Thauera sp. 28]MDG3065475.1 H-NS histone family protein [Thauera mechernichensis]